MPDVHTREILPGHPDTLAGDNRGIRSLDEAWCRGWETWESAEGRHRTSIAEKFSLGHTRISWHRAPAWISTFTDFHFSSFEISWSEYCFLISRLSVQNIDTLIFLISRTGFFSRISESGHMGSVQLSRRNSTPRLSTIKIFKAQFYSNPGVGHLLIFCSGKNQAKVSIICRRKIWNLDLKLSR